MAESPAEQPLILVVEDDTTLASTLWRVLTSAGYRVSIAESGAEARASLDQLEPSLILLDLVLPDADGLVLAATLKTLRSTPILVLSARIGRADRVLALKLGADDFIAKPFDMDELLARVEAVLRRATPPSQAAQGPSDRLQIGELTMVHSRRLVLVGDEPIRLTPTEYRLLRALATHVDEFVSRKTLVELVWGYSGVSPGHLMDTHLWRLRAKLQARGSDAPRIVGERGVGYVLRSEVVAPPGAE